MRREAAPPSRPPSQLIHDDATRRSAWPVGSQYAAAHLERGWEGRNRSGYSADTVPRVMSGRPTGHYAECVNHPFPRGTVILNEVKDLRLFLYPRIPVTSG